MNYIRTQYMTNNGKTCRVTTICCNAPKQTNDAGIVSGKMEANALEVLWTNNWGQPNVVNVNIASVSEMESEYENNNATYFDAVLTFRYYVKGYAPKTLTCILKDVTAVENSTVPPSPIPDRIRSEWTRLGGTNFDKAVVYLASAVLTFHD